MEDSTPLKGYVVTVMRQETLPGAGQKVGYRGKLVAAASGAEAVWRAMREWCAAEPRAAFSQPSYISISPGKLASLGVDMTPFKEIWP